MSDVSMTDQQDQAKAWFDSLRDRICAAFEQLEAEAPAELYAGEPGKFELTPWTRPAGGGGTMGMLRGRVFEKCGVHFSRGPDAPARHPAQRGRPRRPGLPCLDEGRLRQA